MTVDLVANPPVVVASYLPGEGHFHSDRFAVLAVRCSGLIDYWEGLHSVWGTEATIINIEHDLEVSDNHIATLLNCPHPLCSYAYQCHWASSHMDHDIYPHGKGTRYDYPVRYGTVDQEWADWSAIGCLKIEKVARIAELRREPWALLELAVEDAVARPIHLHWPEIRHHHW